MKAPKSITLSHVTNYSLELYLNEVMSAEQVHRSHCTEFILSSKYVK